MICCMKKRRMPKYVINCTEYIRFLHETLPNSFQTTANDASDVLGMLDNDFDDVKGNAATLGSRIANLYW
jgi:hypothetical protein